MSWKVSSVNGVAWPAPKILLLEPMNSMNGCAISFTSIAVPQSQISIHWWIMSIYQENKAKQKHSPVIDESLVCLMIEQISIQSGRTETRLFVSYSTITSPRHRFLIIPPIKIARMIIVKICSPTAGRADQWVVQANSGCFERVEHGKCKQKWPRKAANRAQLLRVLKPSQKHSWKCETRSELPKSRELHLWSDTRKQRSPTSLISHWTTYFSFARKWQKVSLRSAMTNLPALCESIFLPLLRCTKQFHFYVT